jgi:hypothetical protein
MPTNFGLGREKSIVMSHQATFALLRDAQTGNDT